MKLAASAMKDAAEEAFDEVAMLVLMTIKLTQHASIRTANIKARRELARGLIAALSGQARSALQGAGGESRALLTGMERLAGLAPLPAGDTEASSQAVGDGLIERSSDNAANLLHEASRQALGRNECPVARELLRAAVDIESTRSFLIGAAAATAGGCVGLLQLARNGRRLLSGMRRAPFIPALRIRSHGARWPRPACTTRKSWRPQTV